MNKEKISIPLDHQLSEEINLSAKLRGIPRSQFITEILYDWYKNDKRQQLIEGYQTMAAENLKLAKSFASFQDETWLNDSFS